MKAVGRPRCWRCWRWPAAAAAAAARRPPLGLRVHGRQHPGDAARRRAEPGHAVGAGRRGRLVAAGRRRAAAPAPAAMATRAQRCAAWRRATRPSTRRCSGRSTCASASPAAARSCSQQAIAARRRSRRRWRWRPTSPSSRAACRWRRRPTRGWRRRASAAAQLFQQRLGQLDLSCSDCHDAARRPAPGRQPDPAGPPHRLPDLPAGVAGPGLAAAPAARLPERRARRALCLGRAGVDRAGAVPGLARARHADGKPGGAALRRLPLR